jgi:hypothetical protein
VGKTGGLISKYMRGIKSLSQVHMYIYIYDYRVRGKRSGLYTYIYILVFMYIYVYASLYMISFEVYEGDKILRSSIHIYWVYYTSTCICTCYCWYICSHTHIIDIFIHIYITIPFVYILCKSIHDEFRSAPLTTSSLPSPLTL